MVEAPVLVEVIAQEALQAVARAQAGVKAEARIEDYLLHHLPHPAVLLPRAL